MKRIFSGGCVPCLFCLFVLFAGAGASCKKGGAGSKGDSDLAPIVISLRGHLPVFLKESSGLSYTGRGLWSFGDSGNPPWLFRIDSSTGAILQTVQITNYGNTDWEDITADSLYLYVGDFGNNHGNRTDLRILKIRRSDIGDSAEVSDASAEAIQFSYADQTDFTANDNNDFDCESLAAIGDSLYLFTKDHGDLRTRCYVLPKTPGNYSVSPRATFNSGGMITAAAYYPASHELALLGYMSKKVSPFIWFFDGFGGPGLFSGSARRVDFGQSNVEWQTEGLDYVSGGHLFLSCETTPGNPAALYAVEKNF